MVEKEQLSLIYKYFPGLTEVQKKQLEQLYPIYIKWNDRINVISRKDIVNLYLHHVLHSLVLPKILKFKPGSRILDLGTGGGFPGIPLAIYYPEVQFHLIDGRAKKLKVVRAVADSIGLNNITVSHTRIEDMKRGNYDFVLARAVTDLDRMISWARPQLGKKMKHSYPNGLLSYTGGDMKKKLNALQNNEYTEVFPITDYYKNEYFEEKYVVYIQG